MPFRTDPKTLVMAALMDGPRHGYALAKSLRRTLGDAHRIEGAAVYVALRGLEAEGWVEGEQGDGPTERRVYRLTDAGLRELVWRTAEWHEAVETVGRLLRRTVATMA